MNQVKESKNPIFVRLAEQVLLEHNLYKQRDPGLDYLATLLCDFIHHPSYIESCLREFQLKAGSSTLSIETLFEYAICIRLAHKFQLKIDLPTTDDIAFHLADLAKTTHILHP